MHVEFLVEEHSMEAALEELLPRMLRPEDGFKIHPYYGKSDLLKKLVERLRGYARWLPDNWRIVVLLDRNSDDCLELKEKLEAAAAQAGLSTVTSAQNRKQASVLNRIACEELEAWFFGDNQALAQAYPGVPVTLYRRRAYRDSDRIRGGTWEALERVLRRAGYFSGGIPKIRAAATIASHMVPDRNTSRSFQVFRDGLREITCRLVSVLTA